MFNKVVALFALAAGSQAAKLMEPDHIAIALAESLSSSAQHLVQMAAASEVEAAVQPEPVAEPEQALPQVEATAEVDAEAEADTATKTKAETKAKAAEPAPAKGTFDKLPW